MKRIFSLVAILLTMSMYAYAQPQSGTIGKPGGTNDTLAGAVNKTMIINNSAVMAPRSFLAAQLNVTKIDSAVSGYAFLEGSYDNLYYFRINKLDSVTFTNTAGTNAYELKYGPVRCNFHRVRVYNAGSGTPHVTVKGTWYTKTTPSPVN